MSSAGTARDRIYPMPVKAPSKINGWEGWPDDVRDIIRDWNKRCGLSFIRSGVLFKCWDCEAFCEAHAHGAAVFRRKEWLCDDCLIARARSGYKAPETVRIRLADLDYRGGGVMGRRRDKLRLADLDMMTLSTARRLRRPQIQWLRHDHYMPRRQRRLRNITGIVLVMRDGSTTGFRWGKVWNAPRGFFLQFRNENWLTRKLGAHR